MEGKKFPKTFFKELERQNMKNQTIFELYTDENNILAVLWTFLNLKKKIWNSTPSELLQTATTEFVWKIPNRKKISYEHFNLCEAEIFLDEIIKQRHAKLLEKRK